MTESNNLVQLCYYQELPFEVKGGGLTDDMGGRGVLSLLLVLLCCCWGLLMLMVLLLRGK